MITISKCPKEPMPEYSPNPSFGSIFTPHILKMQVQLGEAPTAAEIVPLRSEKLLPTLSSFHYAQCIFEGMKAYKNDNGKINLFRPDQNAKRFETSALKLNMAPVPQEVFLQCLKAFVDFERENVPSLEGHSLYLRPLLIAADQKLKVGQSQKYTFYIIGSVVGNYFSSQAKKKTVSLMVNRDFVRAFPGGLGNVKASANYAMSMSAQTFAEKHGCEQVLFLDSVTHNNIDELGGMNFFAVRGKDLVTPKLNDCILPGVTRDSLLKLANQSGLNPVEETMSFNKLVEDIKSEKVSEIFACGTAAIVQPIGEILFLDSSKSDSVSIALNKPNTLALELRKTLLDMQSGKKEAPTDWIQEV